MREYYKLPRCVNPPLIHDNKTCEPAWSALLMLRGYLRFAQFTLPWATGASVVFAIVSPNGIQPMALLLFLLVLPLCLMGIDQKSKPSLLWIGALTLPLLVSIPLFIGSGTGEALAGAARYFVAAMVLIGLARVELSGVIVLRAASLAGILAIVFNLHQLGEMRVNWGVGFLDSGYVSVLLLGLALAQYHLDKGRAGWRVVSVIGMLCLVFAIAKTGTRGAWPAMFMVICLQFLLVEISLKRKIMVAVIVLMAIALSIFVIPTVKNRVDLTVYEVKSYYLENNRASSVGYRLDFWHIAFECFLESPLWGVSYQRRSEIMDNYVRKYADSATIGTDGRSSSHNELLNALSKKGILGVIAILLLYLVPMRYFVHQFRRQTDSTKRQLALAGVGVSFTMIICGVTEAPLMNVRVGTTYAFLIIFLYHLISKPEVARTNL